MGNYLKKIINKVKSIFNNQRNKRLIEKREKAHKQLIKTKTSDHNRWKNNNELHESWNERTAILGDFIRPHCDILEFGAGNMFLKNYLKNYKSYTPSDIIKRFNDTLVCDLNKPISFDLSIFDVVVFSGVLEYVYNIDSVFNQLSGNNIKQVVISYCCSDIINLSRDKNGWLSDYSKSELEAIFRKYDYEIQDYCEWKKQSIYNLTK
ncbi:hypothetical protein WJN01_07015 [Flavobacteriaceae bacterium SZ-1-7]|uniref:hypothetical protein n=1 Tax=Tamlana sedimenti TaxID=3134126 RepID=UPI0031271E6D